LATVQLRNRTEGRAYYDRRKAAGKTSTEAMRCLKRRLSDLVYRHMLDDAITPTGTSPGGHRGTTTDSSVTGSHPHAGSSDKSLPGPARPDTTPTTAGLPSHPPARSRRLPQRRLAADIKRNLLDAGEDRRTLHARERAGIDTEGSHERKFGECGLIQRGWGSRPVGG
jgi:hypothetical protein